MKRTLSTKLFFCEKKSAHKQRLLSFAYVSFLSPIISLVDKPIQVRTSMTESAMANPTIGFLAESADLCK